MSGITQICTKVMQHNIKKGDITKNQRRYLTAFKEKFSIPNPSTKIKRIIGNAWVYKYKLPSIINHTQKVTMLKSIKKSFDFNGKRVQGNPFV